MTEPASEIPCPDSNSETSGSNSETSVGEKSSRKKHRLAKLGLVVGGIVFALVATEIAARVWKGEYRLVNFRTESLDMFRRALPPEFHPRLGWIPREGHSDGDNVWGTQITILRDGIRANSPGGKLSAAAAGGDLILTVGDSFTFGDEVSDEESWPAILEELAGLPVLNGGVFGYGVDQTYLRMAELVDRYHPTIVIFGLICPNIDRCEISRKSSAPKPYYEIIDGRLALQRDHVQRSNRSSSEGGLRDLLGHSFFAHKIMGRAFPEYWLQGGSAETAHDKGEDVVCRIFGQLGEFVREHPSVRKIYVLVQYMQNPPSWRFEVLDRVLACVDDPEVEIVDLRERFAELRRSDPVHYGTLWKSPQAHMTKAGNTVVAEFVAGVLEGR